MTSKPPRRPKLPHNRHDRKFPLLTMGTRIRLTGTLGTSERGPMLVTSDHSVWIVDSDLDTAPLIGCKVAVEGTKTGLDRLAADYIGSRR